MAKKYYAVKAGRKTGIFESWNKCKEQIHGYSGAVYKSFESYSDAAEFVEGAKKEKKTEKDSKDIVKAYVDGSYFKEEGKYSYGCVLIYNGRETRLKGVGQSEEYASMRNVAGELLGAMEAVKWACENGHEAIRIYHDYEGIERWANGSWKANKEGTKEYVDFIKTHRKCMEIEFEKVLAHSGDYYNDEADRLAKQALMEMVNEPGKTHMEDEVEEKEVKVEQDLLSVFRDFMKKPDRTKNSIVFNFKDYEMSESKLKKFAKEVWEISGFSKDEIDRICMKVDAKESKIKWRVIDKNGSERKFEIEI